MRMRMRMKTKMKTKTKTKMKHKVKVHSKGADTPLPRKYIQAGISHTQTRAQCVDVPRPLPHLLVHLPEQLQLFRRARQRHADGVGAAERVFLLALLLLQNTLHFTPTLVRTVMRVKHTLCHHQHTHTHSPTWTRQCPCTHRRTQPFGAGTKGEARARGV